MMILAFTAIFMPKPTEKMINTKAAWMNNIVRRKIARRKYLTGYIVMINMGFLWTDLVPDSKFHYRLMLQGGIHCHRILLKFLPASYPG